MPELYVIATPIGNLDDISVRARETLAKLDLIAAEDTRHTAKLLSLLNIKKPELVSYHDHNEQSRADQLIQRALKDDLVLGVVSDAGTPCIADPGFRIVRAAHDAGIPVHPVPGPSASISLVAASGLPSDRILFEGFLPPKVHGVTERVKSWIGLSASVVFFDSPRRFEKTLGIIQKIFPHGRVAIGRELTKLHEEVLQLSVQDALVWTQSRTSLKGELTVMLDPRLEDQIPDREALESEARQGLSDGKSFKDLLSQLGERGLKKSELYQLLLKVKNDL